MGPTDIHLELWHPGGFQLADLSGRARSRRITQSRNAAEDIAWTLDLGEFERYCREIHTDPASLLAKNRTEVRVRFGSKYLCGGVLNSTTHRVTPQGATIELRAWGYLNWFLKRFTAAERTYTQVQATDIAWSLINESQSKGPDWDFGITRGLVAATGLHDRTYKDDEIKASLVNLTNVQVAPFDFEFSYDKVFHTYAQLGSVRDDVVFEYPGTILSFDWPDDGTELANTITMLGAGSGLDQTDGGAAVRVTVEDAASQDNYYVMEERVNDSSVSKLDTLTQNGLTELAKWATPIKVPTLTVDGGRFPLVTDYGIGDYVKVRQRQYASLEQGEAFYRVEQREIVIDEDDAVTVNLTVAR